MTTKSRRKFSEFGQLHTRNDNLENEKDIFEFDAPRFVNLELLSSTPAYNPDILNFELNLKNHDDYWFTYAHYQHEEDEEADSEKQRTSSLLATKGPQAKKENNVNHSNKEHKQGSKSEKDLHAPQNYNEEHHPKEHKKIVEKPIPKNKKRYTISATDEGRFLPVNNKEIIKSDNFFAFGRRDPIKAKMSIMGKDSINHNLFKKRKQESVSPPKAATTTQINTKTASKEPEEQTESKNALLKRVKTIEIMTQPKDNLNPVENIIINVNMEDKHPKPQEESKHMSTTSTKLVQPSKVQTDKQIEKPKLHDKLTDLQKQYNHKRVEKPQTAPISATSTTVENPQHPKKFAPAYVPAIHSARDVRNWEKLSGKKWYDLNAQEREQANNEIQQMIRGKLPIKS